MIAHRIYDALQEDNRAWIESDIAKVYVRRNHRSIEGDRFKVLDVAAFEVHKRYQRLGIFSVMLAECEAAARMMECGGVYVESIQNPIVPDILARRGYHVVRHEWIGVCMFKRLTDEGTEA